MSAEAARRGLQKVITTGTHRVRHPDETWEIVAPLLPKYGITRVADVTRLDILGIPVMMAVRPLARTLSVSQGKGQTLPLARVSAVMESIEFWHAEYARAATLCSDMPARDLGLSYRIEHLAAVSGSIVDELTRLDWVGATTLCTGRRSMVPANIVHLYSPDESWWRPPGLVEDTTGLASGNAWEEAVLHGLYEVVERDSLSRQPIQQRPAVIDLNTIDDQALAAMVATIEEAGANLGLFYISNRFDIPCYAAFIWSGDFPIISVGYGAHLAHDVAASRAVTEAAQSRLTGIVGNRDDQPEIYRRVRQGPVKSVRSPRPTLSWQNGLAMPHQEFVELSGELAYVSAAVRRVVGYEPLVVDLSTEDMFSVVKVIVPGATVDSDRVTPPTGAGSFYMRALVDESAPSSGTDS